MVPGNTRELANWLIPAWKSKVVSAQNPSVHSSRE